MLLRNFLLLMNGRKSARGCLCVEEHAGKGDIRVHLKNSLRLHHGGFSFFRYILVRSCNAGVALRDSAPYNPCQGTEFPGPSAFAQNHAAASARPRSARTLRASLCAAAHRGQEGLRPPAPPARELSSLDLPLFTQSHAALPARPRSARTLRVSLCAVALREQEGLRPPAPPARELSSLDLPLFTQNHAALPARPRSARTLRVSLCAAAHAFGLR